MPTITVTAPQGAIDQGQRDALMKQLSDTLLKFEGASTGNPAAQAIAWTYFQEAPSGTFYVGGEATSSPRFKIEVTTPQGALNDSSRAGLSEAINAIVHDVIGEAGSGFNHWVLFGEIAEGHWGVAGKIFRHADIIAAVRGPRASA
ncbi:4-oxalocrotonate tautomerase family protein [Glycocaulis abyssi]|uniref:4-oxalocrotonate tautomerase family protein n=1 Tax=Glycocaulis abyssi TaxID=1433403 RepID=A0ABV9N6D3_9PROT